MSTPTTGFTNGPTPGFTYGPTSSPVVTTGPTPGPGQTYPPSWNWDNPPNWDTMKQKFGWNGKTATVLSEPEPVVNASLKFKNGNNENKTCPQPEDPKMPDIDEKMADILKASGGDQQCKKTSDLFHQDSSGSIRGNVDTLLGSAEMEAKFQENSTSQKNTQIGCGTLMIKASNIISKQSAMQCIVNNCQSNATITANVGASITINTLPLSTQAEIDKAQIIDAQNQLYLSLTTGDSNLLANLILKGASTDQITLFTQFSNGRIDLLKNANKAQLELYSRDINISGTTLTASSQLKLSAKLQLSSDAQNKLSALSESISKDVAAMQVSNKLGVDALDPNVKNLVNQNSSKSSSTASSSITNISQNTNITASSTSNITINAPGVINLTNTTINSTSLADIVVQQIMTQAVTNGIVIAAKALTDNQGIQNVLNQVKGLDDFQNAVANTIGKGTDAPPGFFDKKTSWITYLLIGAAALIGLVIVMKIINAQKGASPPPVSKFRALGDIAHRLRYKRE
jgi:hypothetical protein